MRFVTSFKRSLIGVGLVGLLGGGMLGFRGHEAQAAEPEGWTCGSPDTCVPGYYRCSVVCTPQNCSCLIE
jgi:hypothetical protein